MATFNANTLRRRNGAKRAITNDTIAAQQIDLQDQRKGIRGKIVDIRTANVGKRASTSASFPEQDAAAKVRQGQIDRTKLRAKNIKPGSRLSLKTTGGRLTGESQAQFEQRMAKGRVNSNKKAVIRNARLTKKVGHNPRPNVFNRAERQFIVDRGKNKLGNKPTQTRIGPPTRVNKIGGIVSGAATGPAINQDKRAAQRNLDVNQRADLKLTQADVGRTPTGLRLKGSRSDVVQGSRDRLALRKRVTLNKLRLSKLAKVRGSAAVAKFDRLKRATTSLEDKLATATARANATSTKITGPDVPRSGATQETQAILGKAKIDKINAKSDALLPPADRKKVQKERRKLEKQQAKSARKGAFQSLGDRFRSTPAGEAVAKIKSKLTRKPKPSAATTAGETVGSTAKTAGEKLGAAAATAKANVGDFVEGVKTGAGVADSKTVQPDAQANPAAQPKPDAQANPAAQPKPDARVKDSKTVQPDAQTAPDAKPKSLLDRSVDGLRNFGSGLAGKFKRKPTEPSSSNAGDTASNQAEADSADRLKAANKAEAERKARAAQKKNTAKQDAAAAKVESKTAFKNLSRVDKLKVGAKSVGKAGAKFLAADVAVRGVRNAINQTVANSSPGATVRNNAGNPIGGAAFVNDVLSQDAGSTLGSAALEVGSSVLDAVKHPVNTAVDTANTSGRGLRLLSDVAQNAGDLAKFGPDFLANSITGNTPPQADAVTQKRSADLSFEAAQRRAGRGIAPPVPLPVTAPEAPGPNKAGDAVTNPTNIANRTTPLRQFNAAGNPINDPVAANNNPGLQAAIAAEQRGAKVRQAQFDAGVNPNTVGSRQIDGSVDPVDNTVTSFTNEQVPFNLPRTLSQKGLSIPTDLDQGTGFIRSPDGSITRLAFPQKAPTQQPTAQPNNGLRDGGSIFRGGTPKTVDQALAQRIIGNGIRQQQNIVSAGRPSFSDATGRINSLQNGIKDQFNQTINSSKEVGSIISRFDLNTVKGLDDAIGTLGASAVPGALAAQGQLVAQGIVEVGKNNAGFIDAIFSFFGQGKSFDVSSILDNIVLDGRDVSLRGNNGSLTSVASLDDFGEATRKVITQVANK